jgi:hypothetical protein
MFNGGVNHLDMLASSHLGHHTAGLGVEGILIQDHTGQYGPPVFHNGNGGVITTGFKG